MAAPTLTQPTIPGGAVLAGQLPVLHWIKADGTLVFANDTTPLPVTAVPAANPSVTAVTWVQATKIVAASGTPERLAAATTLCESVLLEGKNARGTNNTGNVWVGTTSGNDTQLLMIAPGTAYTLTAPDGKKLDLNLIYVDVATNSDGITYTAFN